MDKRTHKDMTYRQRLFLEAVRQIGEATLTEIADETGSTHDRTKSIAAAMVDQGYVTVTRSRPLAGHGRAPGRYKLSGKPFPPSAQTKSAVGSSDAERYARPAVPTSPEIAILVAGMNAMVQTGRASA